MQGFRSKELSSSGKRKLVFSRSDAFWPELSQNQLTVPCGQCVGCRLERSRQWAVRCVHEASLHEFNCFITLTYSNEFLPADGSLNLDHFQRFMKRLRKRFGDGIRFFHCGEYGSLYGRPHYHALLFNFDFSDKVLWKEENGQKLYRSAILESLWPFGHCSVGSATFESAAYVARYIMKKVTGEAAADHYWSKPDLFGVINPLKPEYTTMSRRPGIGKGWFEKFSDETYRDDNVVLRGKKMLPPKYYDRLYELTNPSEHEDLKFRRKMNAAKHKDDNTPERLAVKLKVKLSKIKGLVRNLDKDDLNDY